eukprot:288045-Prorocentrum_minimum.AAC.2
MTALRWTRCARRRGGYSGSCRRRAPAATPCATACSPATRPRSRRCSASSPSGRCGPDSGAAVQRYSGTEVQRYSGTE